MSYLRNTWYIAAWGKEIANGVMLRRRLLNEFYVLFRDNLDQPRSLVDSAQQLADEAIAVAIGPEGVFTTEEMPIIEAQAENMLGRPFWEMKPRLLSIDAASVQARRILAGMIEREQAAAG
jgi:16S rRNA U1498 N3-methylase RsmE